MAGTYTATLYRQANGREAWKIISPAGKPVQHGIESDHDLEAILADYNSIPAEWDNAESRPHWLKGRREARAHRTVIDAANAEEQA